MSSSSLDEQEFIRGVADDGRAGEDGRILWSIHAAGRLVRTPWSRVEVEHALASAEVIEVYPEATRALPDCLALAHVGADPLHAVLALDVRARSVIVVTVYRPDPRRWLDDFRKRRP